ncbi:MAG: flagellar filament capping protein FliD [Vampirovibrionales bacterium]
MMSTKPPITLNTGGLSGSGIIEQLVERQRRPIDQLQQRVRTLQNNKSAVTQIQNRFTSLNNTLRRITSTSVLDADLFQAKRGNSTDKESIDISATDKAAVQGMDIKVNRLATSTIARSASPIGVAATGSTKLTDIKNVSFVGGNVSLIVGGQLHTLSIDTATDNITSILGKIAAVPGITGANINSDGQVSILTDNATSLQIGSSGDTSNFFRLTRLNTATAIPPVSPSTNKTFTSSFRLTPIDVSKNVEDVASNLVTPVTAASSFTIGGATFSTTGKSLAQLVADINNTQSAGVSATMNHSTGRLELTARNQGNVPMTLKDNSGNFLRAMGLIDGSGNSLTSQTLGQNAEIEVNGSVVLSNSNTVDAGTSGLTGVTLSLKKVTTTAVRVNVERDTEQINSALTSFVGQLNDALNGIATNTNLKTGALSGNSILNGLRSSIRSLMTSSVSGNPAFQSLGAIGIGTGKAGSFSSGGTVNTAYSLDTAALKTALDTNADAVKSLVAGPNGIITRIRALVDNAVQTGTAGSGSPTTMGAFQTLTTSFDSQITRVNRSIDSSNRRLTKFEENLRRQYAAVDRQNSQSQSQLQSLSSIF